jgi:hypothetical protein
MAAPLIEWGGGKFLGWLQDKWASLKDPDNTEKYEEAKESLINNSY